MARTIAGEAKYHELSGHPARAVDSLLDGIEMGVMLPHGGNLIVGLVAIACEAICTSRLEPLLPRLSEPELAHVAVRLDQIDAKRVSYSDILLEECYSHSALTQEALHDPKMRNAEVTGVVRLIQGAADETGSKPSWGDRWKGIHSLFADKGELLHEDWDYFHALAKEAQQPYTGKSSVPAPWGEMSIAAMLGDTLVQGRAKFAAMEAVTELLRGEVALNRYRAARGRFPETLAELTPVYLKAIPIDPLGQGRPLRYRLRNGQNEFLLYSLGVNLIDDGGVASRFPGDTTGDMVAGALWRKKTAGQATTN